MFRKFNKNSHVKGICFALLVALMSLTGIDIAVSKVGWGYAESEDFKGKNSNDDVYKDVRENGKFDDNGNYMIAASKANDVYRQVRSLDNDILLAQGKQKAALQEISKHCKDGKKDNKKCTEAKQRLDAAEKKEQELSKRIEELNKEGDKLTARTAYLETLVNEKAEKAKATAPTTEAEPKTEAEAEPKTEAPKSEDGTGEQPIVENETNPSQQEVATPSGSTTTNTQAKPQNVTGCSSDYGLFSGLIKTGSDIFKGLRDLIYVVAGFGIIGVAVGGFFGNLNWKWLGAILIALVVIASTGEIINMITGCDNFSANMITDTLK